MLVDQGSLEKVSYQGFQTTKNHKFHKIYYQEVCYIESLRNHILLLTPLQRYVSLIAISDMEARLPADAFMRIHRSYIVRLDRIDRFTQSSVVIGEQVLPLGGAYKEGVLRRLRERVL